MLKHRLDQTGTAYEAVFYVLAAALFLRSYQRAGTPLLRQQLKWLTRGRAAGGCAVHAASTRFRFCSTSVCRSL